MLRLLQINLNHCVAAQALLEQTTREQQINAVIISEPHHQESINKTNWVVDSNRKAAIWSCGAPMIPLTHTGVRDPKNDD